MVTRFQIDNNQSYEEAMAHAITWGKARSERAMANLAAEQARFQEALDRAICPEVQKRLHIEVKAVFEDNFYLDASVITVCAKIFRPFQEWELTTNFSGSWTLAVTLDNSDPPELQRQSVGVAEHELQDELLYLWYEVNE